MSIDDYKGGSPEFLPERFFDGHLEGWAVLESLTGTLQKRATISAHGQWDAGSQTVHLTETHRFDDGPEDALRWTIRKTAPGQYSGAEPRVEGEAKGEQAGFAYNWKYTRETPQADGTSVKLNFDDWFYLIEERVCIVHGSTGKLGLPFATAHVTYRKMN